LLNSSKIYILTDIVFVYTYGPKNLAHTALLIYPYGPGNIFIRPCHTDQLDYLLNLFWFWLIDCCLTSSKLYFSCNGDWNKFTLY